MTREQRSPSILQAVTYQSAKYSQLACILTIFIMFVASVLDVIASKLFSRPLTGCVELVEELMVISVFLALGFTELHKDHLKVTAIPILLPKTIRKILRTLVYSFGAIMTIILCYRNVALLSVYWEFKSAKQIFFYFPLWPTAFVMFCGSIIFLIAIIYSMLNPPSDYI